MPRVMLPIKAPQIPTSTPVLSLAMRSLLFILCLLGISICTTLTETRRNVIEKSLQAIDQVLTQQPRPIYGTVKYEVVQDGSRKVFNIYAFPGTDINNYNEIMSNLIPATRELVVQGRSVGRIHEAYLNRSTFLTDDIIDRAVQDLKENPNLHVIFTGHSMGATAAAITTIRVLEKYLNDPSFGMIYDRIWCVTIAQMPFADSNVQNHVATLYSDRFINFMHEQDPFKNGPMQKAAAIIGAMANLFKPRAVIQAPDFRHVGDLTFINGGFNPSDILFHHRLETYKTCIAMYVAQRMPVTYEYGYI